MRNIFRSTSFKVLIAVAVMLLAALTAGAVLKDGSSPVTSVVSTVFSPLSKACSSIADKFENFKGGFVSSKRYMEKQAELEQEIADYQSKLVDYERLKKQVAAYEKFLGVKEQHPDFSFAAGTVIGRDSADMFGSFQLSCGEKDGVSVGDPVISGEYLLGQVKEVGPTSCVVISVCDPKLSAAAYEIRTGEDGYTKSTAKLGTQGFLKLSGLSKDTAVAEGGAVCTSGVGGVFPRDLIIGKVVSLEKEAEDISYYAKVQPEIEISDVQEAFVIIAFEGKGHA